VERRKAMTPAMVAVLRESLREVCSLEDVEERMGRFMSAHACQEVLLMMCQVCKVRIFFLLGILLFYPLPSHGTENKFD
jgi:hypothetical protein